MNRGSHRSGRMVDARGLRFNEAPIHESGKSYFADGTTSSASGFNEAPIHESGK